MFLPDKRAHICNGKSTDTVRLCDDVARSLNFIYGKYSVSDPLAVCSNNLCSHKGKGKTQRYTACLICGRYITSTSLSVPLEESEPLGKPKATNRMDSRSVVENIVQKQSGSQDLRNILLLITPVELPSQQPNCHKVHSYCLYSHSHLGVTTLTNEELQLIERYHRSDNYSIVYCSRYVELVDAVRNTPIKGQIFEIVRSESKAVLRTWYRGNAVRLSYRGSRSRRVGVSPSRNPYGIRSLEQPKIPVRMQHQSPSYMTNISHAAIEDKKTISNQRRSLRQNLRRTFQREFYYPIQKSLEKINIKPSYNYSNFSAKWDTVHSTKKAKRIGLTINKLQLQRSVPLNTRCYRKTKKQAEDELSIKPAICQPKLCDTGRRCQVKDRIPMNEVDIHKHLEGTKECSIMHSKGIQKCQRQRKTSSVSEMDLMEKVLPLDMNDIQMLWDPQELRESIGHIPLPSMTPRIKGQESIIYKSSATFARLMDPPMLPASYSLAANIQLKRNLKSLSVKQAFSKFGRLVEQINEQLCPRQEHLLTFFQIAEILDFKMFVRLECSFPCWAPTKAERFRIECYVFDDQRDFIASIAMLCRQLPILARICPGVTKNIRFVDNAFELTSMPLMLTSWLKAALNAIHARPIYNFLGELTYNWAHPPATLLDLTRDQESNK